MDLCTGDGDGSSDGDGVGEGDADADGARGEVCTGNKSGMGLSVPLLRFQSAQALHSWPRH